MGIEPIGSDVTKGEGRKGTVSRSLLQIQSKKASRRELEKVSRCRLQFDLTSPGTILGFGARLARERSRFTVPSAGTWYVCCGVSVDIASPTDHTSGMT